MIDEVIVISSAEAIEAAKVLQRDYHLCVGISSGANFLAAKRLQKRFNNVITVFADGYMKYQTFGLEAATCPLRNRCRESVIAAQLASENL